MAGLEVMQSQLCPECILANIRSHQLHWGQQNIVFHAKQTHTKKMQLGEWPMTVEGPQT